MKKVLIIASVASMIEQFNMNNIEILQSLGYAVDVACNFRLGSGDYEGLKKLLRKRNVEIFQIDFTRNVYDIRQDYTAYCQIRELLVDDRYQFIHCHSPIGGVVGRLAARNFHIPVIYTAHGFHFFKGAPIKNWLLFFPVEKWLSKYTKVLITINNEDFRFAKKQFKTEKIIKIPGIGLDIDRFSEERKGRQRKCEELGIDSNAFIVLSVGELNDNKNHETIIRALHLSKIENAIYLLCGEGPRKDYLQKLSADLGVSVKFLGFRKDVDEMYEVADVFAFPSKREGLGMAALEAMAKGVPIVTSNIHGIQDYSENGRTGFSGNPTDAVFFAESFVKLYNHKELREEMGLYNKTAVKRFASSETNRIMEEVYREM